MPTDFVAAKVQNALLIVLTLSAPVVLAAVVIGVLVGLGQALTQIQDQTLPQAVKLIVILLIILVFGPLLAGQIAEQASMALEEFPVVTR